MASIRFVSARCRRKNGTLPPIMAKSRTTNMFLKTSQPSKIPAAIAIMLPATTSPGVTATPARSNLRLSEVLKPPTSATASAACTNG
jgi:hypothetical protein